MENFSGPDFLETMGAIRISKAKVKYTDNSHLSGVLVEPINFLKQGGKIWIYPEVGLTTTALEKTQSLTLTFLHQQTKAPICR